MLYVGTCVYFIEDTFGELSAGNTVWYFFLAGQILGGLRLFSDFFFNVQSLANIKILKAELKLFLTIDICQQCRGKLDEELLQVPEAAEKTAASSWLYEEAKEQTQCTETENPLAVRSTC